MDGWTLINNKQVKNGLVRYKHNFNSEVQILNRFWEVISKEITGVISGEIRRDLGAISNAVGCLI